MRKGVTSLSAARSRSGGDAGSDGTRAPRSETLGQAYVRRYAEMHAFLRSRVGNSESADELMQEAWIAIAANADDTTLDNPDAWLQRVITNLALNWLKSSRFRASFFTADGDFDHISDAVPLPDEQAQGRQSLSYLSRLIDELPPQQRAIFLLYRGEGLSLQETADRLGIRVRTVATQLQRTMIILRKRMLEAELWP